MSELVKQVQLRFKKYESYTREEITNSLMEINGGGIPLPQQNPTAFTYNRVNVGQGAFIPLFERVKQSEYIFLDENYPYSGELLHKAQGFGPRVVGIWEKGKLKWLDDGVYDFDSWKASLI